LVISQLHVEFGLSDWGQTNLNRQSHSLVHGHQRVGHVHVDGRQVFTDLQYRHRKWFQTHIVPDCCLDSVYAVPVKTTRDTFGLSQVNVGQVKFAAKSIFHDLAKRQVSIGTDFVALAFLSHRTSQADEKRMQQGIKNVTT
jgi:hypothetical protein